MFAAFRKAARPPNSPLSFSSAAALSNSNTPQSFSGLADLLAEEAERQPIPRQRTYFSVLNAPHRHDVNLTWKPFAPGYFVRPHELTYKSRFKSPRLPLRRPAVGPSSAEARYRDTFHQFGIDPLSQALNPAILSAFVSEMGKIYGRYITGLTPKSQRRIGKAIRRAKMMGVIPILSRPSSNPRAWSAR